MAQYKPQNYDEQVIKDFLIWCGREKAAVLVDITPNVARMSSFTFIDQMKAVEEYLEGKQCGN